MQKYIFLIHSNPHVISAFLRAYSPLAHSQSHSKQELLNRQEEQDLDETLCLCVWEACITPSILTQNAYAELMHASIPDEIMTLNILYIEDKQTQRTPHTQQQPACTTVDECINQFG